MPISLRDELPGDEPLLRRLIIDSTAARLGASVWPEPMRSQLLEIQYASRRQSIRQNFPGGRSRILQIDGVDAGWLFVAELPNELRLVEILLDPACRGRGAGTQAIHIVFDEARAAGKPVRLSVDTSNTGAIRLYDRLGFSRIGGDEVRQWMERPALAP